MSKDDSRTRIVRRLTGPWGRDAHSLKNQVWTDRADFRLQRRFTSLRGCRRLVAAAHWLVRPRTRNTSLQFRARFDNQARWSILATAGARWRDRSAHCPGGPTCKGCDGRQFRRSGTRQPDNFVGAFVPRIPGLEVSRALARGLHVAQLLLVSGTWRRKSRWVAGRNLAYRGWPCSSHA